jgi:acyl-CoA synthetase (AMP-forming)/AMP-acid ligase II
MLSGCSIEQGNRVMGTDAEGASAAVRLRTADGPDLTSLDRAGGFFVAAPPKTLRTSIAGGMALQEAVALRWKKTTGTEVIEGYGLTEASPVLTFNPTEHAKPGSIGVPLPSTEVKCVDDQGGVEYQTPPRSLLIPAPSRWARRHCGRGFPPRRLTRYFLPPTP